MRSLLGVFLLAPCLAGCGASQTTIGVPDATSVAPFVRRSLTYQVLYSFKGHRTRDGGHPSTTLVQVDGTFYGATAGVQRGRARYGTIFSITPSGTEKTLFVFKGGPEQGAHPTDLVNVGGTLFGTTTSGGTNGWGTVFSITRTGRETTLHNFAGGKGDGAHPHGLVDVGGTLYGTTSAGGTKGDGTVFAVTPSGTETVLYNFTGGKTDGAKPVAPLVDVQGTLYGTAANAGEHGNGTVFAITPSGTETVLYSFKGGMKDGAGPLAPLADAHGVLYGTTWSGGSAHCGGGGCGTVFAITPSGQERVVYAFAGPDGAYPSAAVVDVRGTIYATTNLGGANGIGTVFAIKRSGEEFLLHSFSGYPTDGDYAAAALLSAGGTLYGTTEYGGSAGAGTVFALTP